jgi:hypothetical protein
MTDSGRDDTGRELLPIACTLGPSSSRDRLSRWTALNDAYRVGSSRSDGRYVVRYRHTGESRAELETLVAGERDCCGFVSWSSDVIDGELRLTVEGSADQIDGVLFVADAHMAS